MPQKWDYTLKINLTASQQAKAAGLKSLAVVTQITGVSPQTLINWHKHKPDLFRVVIAGCTKAP
jgi:hypothetical protein